MSSESNYKGVETSSNSSSDQDSKPLFRPGSRRQLHAPLSPRKRRRDESDDPLRDRKRHLDGKYHDAYRILFNNDVNRATTRIDVNEPYQYYTSQVGASVWSSQEKSRLFAALERLGKDNIPAIAKAIETKSIPETRDFLLLLQDASERQGDAKVTLGNIPAAIEIGNECEARLELAGDALAWYQERFEAKQEQERYGRFWLLTPAIAEEIEYAIGGTRSRALSSSPALGPFEPEDGALYPANNAPIPQILQDVPEARLLHPDNMLTLSKHLFMNRSSSIPSPWPHWSEFVSELASQPSLYRTAFNDFHALVVSLTKRLMQAAIMQATSRLRAQRRRDRKGVLPYVKRRDVLSAIDILGMERNGKDRWRGVARRCGVQVFEGRFDANRKGKREVPWDEVERILSSLEPSTEPLSTDAETTDFTSGPEDNEDFKARAVRSGTPLPTLRLSSPEDEDTELDFDYQEHVSSVENSSRDEASQSPLVARTDLDLGQEFDQLEDFDRDASRQQELELWELIGVIPPEKAGPSKLSEDGTRRTVATDKITSKPDGWRNWTDYRPPWEEFRNPIPEYHFLANQKPSNSLPIVPSQGLLKENANLVSEAGSETDASSNLGAKYMKQRRANTAEIPIRGARAYAALQERMSVPVDETVRNYDSDEGNVDPIVQSVENEVEEMDWDT